MYPFRSPLENLSFGQRGVRAAGVDSVKNRQQKTFKNELVMGMPDSAPGRHSVKEANIFYKISAIKASRTPTV